MTFEITYGSDSKGDDKEKEENTVEFHFLDFWRVGSNDGRIVFYICYIFSKSIVKEHRLKRKKEGALQ